MDNVPEVVLSKINKSSEQWEDIDITKLEWDKNEVVAMTRWLDNARFSFCLFPFPLIVKESSIKLNISYST